MQKCGECSCLGGYHMTYCSKYNPAKDGYPRKKKHVRKEEDADRATD
jgi:hypothetical protein